jgi:hypothetical protein
LLKESHETQVRAKRNPTIGNIRLQLGRRLALGDTIQLLDAILADHPKPVDVTIAGGDASVEEEWYADCTDNQRRGMALEDMATNGELAEEALQNVALDKELPF